MQGPVLTILLFFYNIFVVSSVMDILNIKMDFQIIMTIAVMLAISRFVSMELERHKSRHVTVILTEINNLWLWASFMYLFEIIFFFIVGLFINMPLYVRLAIILLIPLLAIAGYYTAYHNYIKGYELYLNEKSNINSSPMTIIHISDIHYGSMARKKLLKRTVKSINSIASKEKNSKVITVISGDAADGSTPIEIDDFLPLKDIKVPVLFTPGNHDYYPGIDNVKKALRNAGVIILDNDNMEYAQENINIIGLSFSFDENDNSSYKLPIKEDMNNIIIYHAPFYWKEFSNMGIELELSGHTHGGQFYPVILFCKRMFKYNRGLFNRQVKKDGKQFTSYLSVTEGIGFFAVPVRLGTHSEIAVLHINRIKRH